jgi:hypothetical protein
VAKLVARSLATADILQKIINERHKQRSGQHTLTREKNLQQNLKRIGITLASPVGLYETVQEGVQVMQGKEPELRTFLSIKRTFIFKVLSGNFF